MNEARILNFALIGSFILMLCAYIFTVHFSSHIFESGAVITTVSAFCG